jgi:hypothetical protein
MEYTRMNRENKKNSRSSIGRLSRHKKSLLLASSLLLFSSASFADWDVVPLIKVGGEHDDNPQLDPRTDQEINLTGVLAEVSADFIYTTNQTNFNLVPILLHRSYSDNPEFDSDDLFIRSNYAHRFKSSSLGFLFRFDEQTVRTAERSDVDLDLEDPDEIDGNETGGVALSGDRQKIRFGPYWSWNISDVSSIGARVDYFDVSYDDVFLGALTAYTDSRLTLDYRRAISNRNRFVALLSGRQYEADDASVQKVNGSSAQIGIERDMTQTSRVRTMIGVENTEQPDGSKEPEMIGDITFTQRLETITMFAQYRRSVNASGSGQVSARDQININFTRRLNQKISAGLGVRAYKTRHLASGTSIFNEREYIQLRGSFAWYLSPSFSLEADYRYTVLDRGPLLDGRANSNRINLWFVYQRDGANR